MDSIAIALAQVNDQMLAAQAAAGAKRYDDASLHQGHATVILLSELLKETAALRRDLAAQRNA